MSFKVAPLSVLLLFFSLADGFAEIVFVALSKTQSFAQFNPHIAFLDVEEDEENPLSFEVFLQGSGEGSIISGEVMVGGSLRSLAPDGESWNLTERFDSKEEFDAAFPSSSTYEIAAGTPAGAASFVLELTADNYPNVPFVTNWSALQEADSTGAVTIEWESFAGGTSNDHISLGVELEGPGGGGVFQSPSPGQAGALDGTSDSFSLPAGTLEPGRNYTVTVSFYRIVGTAGGGIGSAAAFGKQNRFPLTTITGSDTRAPRLRYSNPENNRGTVPHDSSIMFQFDEPMDQSVNLEAAIQWEGGLDPSDLTFVWSDDGMRLFCLVDGGLPAATTFSWELNPAGAGGTPGMELVDLAGNRLPPRSGSFTTADTLNEFTGNARWYYLIRSRHFGQLGATISPREDFRVYAGVGMSSYNSLSRIVAIIGGNELEMDGERREDRVEGSANYFEQSDQGRFFPAAGSYGFVFRPTGSLGETSVALTTPSGTFPDAPVITNHLEVLAVDPASDFTLSWEPVTGSGPGDFFLIVIDNSYGRSVVFTPLPGQSGALVTDPVPASTTSLVIPAGTLPPGRNLNLSIAHVVVDGRNVGPQFGTGTSGMASLTTTDLVTLGDPIVPELTEVSGDPSGFQFVVNGERGVPYTIECSTDGESWNTILSQSADGSSSGGPEGSFSFFTTIDSETKLFRAVEGELSGTSD
ncbi:MAG: hypothetical protein CMO40_04375 [Verrucomicrobiaceae bacterium]|nr:hypothetical protein [Verrucomicrobiaceae bacterium]